VAAWDTAAGHEALVQEVGSPILLLPNDVTFLAVIAPLSLVLLVGKPWSLTGVLAVLSLLASACIVVILRSRTAMLTMIVSMACTSALIQLRRRLTLRLACGLTSLFLALLVDWFFAFPLLSKFIHQWYGSGRIALWLATWAMFLDAPWLGHEPHTFVLRYQAWLSDLGLPISSVTIPWAHNLYLELLAEQGIIGFTVFGVLLAHRLSRAWRTQRAASTEARLLGAGVFGGLIGLCGAAADELTLLREWVVVMLLMFLGISAHLTSSRSTEGRVSE
jgi:O-antigen ligase